MLYSLAEHQLGHCTVIRVEAREWSFSVSDNGRGHAIDRTVAGSPYLKFIYTHFDYPFAADAQEPVQLQGIGMSLINALCSELTLTVRQPGMTLRMQFANGHLQHQQRLEEAPGNTGNTVSGTVASRLSPGFDEVALDAWLRRVKSSAPSVALHFNGREVHARAQNNV